MDQKTFYQALIDLTLYPHKAKLYLNDKRLTILEKKILEGHILIRNNQNQDVIKLLGDIAPSELPFVEGHRHFILGQVHNNLSHYHQAEDYFFKALPSFISANAYYFIFSSYYELFIVNSNLGRIDKMKEYLGLMEKVPELTELHKNRILKSRFDYYSESNQFDRAEEVLNLINQKKSEFVDSDVISHLVCEFMFHIKKEDLKSCQTTLQEMKSYRKFHLTENYNFMKKLLDHLIHDAPIYAYDSDFQKIPMLFLQLKVIQSFESGDRKLAQKYWDDLAKIFPETYLHEFNYCGPKNLFSLCLKKYVSKIEPRKIQPGEGSKLEILVKILKDSKNPLTKGLIYEMIWGESPVEKDDYNKLTRMIYKARIEYGLDIQSRKGTYFIQGSKEKGQKTG